MCIIFIIIFLYKSLRKLVMALKILLTMSITFNLLCSMPHPCRAEKPRCVKAISVKFKKNANQIFSLQKVIYSTHIQAVPCIVILACCLLEYEDKGSYRKNGMTREYV